MKRPKKSGTVHKLTGKRHRPYIARAYIETDIYGKVKHKTIGYFKTKSEAEIALLEYNQKPYNLDALHITLKQLFDMWSEESDKAENKTTYQHYIQGFRLLEPLHKSVFKDIKPMAYQKLINDLSENYSRNYLKNLTMVLHELYPYAIMQDIVTVDYSKTLKLKGKSKQEQAYFTQSEVSKMVQNLGTIDNIDMLLILCLMGLRPSEMLQMTRFNVDFEKHIVSGIGIKTEAGKKKRVPISDILMPFLERRCKSTLKYLFTTEKGYQMTYSYFVNKVYKPCLKALEIEYKPPKAGRHFFATISNQVGVNDRARIEMLGHATVDITNEHYTHIQDTFIQSEYAKIDDVFKNLR